MLEVKNLCCMLGGHEVLRGVSFTVLNGEIATIIGGSGAGKTTIIRALCGLEKIFADTIEIDQNKPRHGDYGLVQQGYCLFEHMTVLDNVSYALRTVKKLSKEKANDIASKLLIEFGLSSKLKAYPNSLSGGQKQRVAIARTLVMDPKVFLFDEPTSALDPEMTSDVINIIRKIAERGMAILIVTHDLMMARKISDRILFLEHGKIIENRLSKEFFADPHSSRAKSFLKNAACL